MLATYGKRNTALTFVVDFTMETDTITKMSETGRVRMTRSRVKYLVPFLFLGILSACGGEDTVASEVVSPAVAGIAAPSGVAAVPSN